MHSINKDRMKTGGGVKRAKICHLAVLYHSKIKFLKYDINSWKYGEPGDWNMWRRMKEAGVRTGFVNKVVGKHYLERTQRRILEEGDIVWTKRRRQNRF